MRHAPLETLGMALQSHAAFPQGCNVGFVERVSREEVKLRVLERGAGETRACGSGACAAAAWLHKIGHTSDKVRVVQSGGSLVISFDRDDGSLTLTGPAKKVFEGLLE